MTERSIIRKKKRGLINGLSYIFKWSFGMPNADDAQYYEDSIKMLTNNNRQTQTLLKSQVQIIANAIRNFNNSLFSLESQEKAMNQNIQKINSFTAQTNSYISDLEMITTFNQQITILHILDNIVFALQIPLADKMKFELYEIIPLPIQHNNSQFFSYIMPQSNYLLLSQSRSQYTFLNGLSDCHEYQDEQYICYHLHTITSNSNPPCEIELLSPHMTRIPASCTTKTIKATIETWHHIGRNQWIYILQKPTTLTIMCEENENHLEDVILQKVRDSTKNATYYIPHMNIIADDCCILQTHFSTTE
ncbi:uncharacterized protein LOC135161002 [Diachasmimorpha longicaudata]|uniref:uncharacterized protein LOC135161002 n=1 Tax=Diachasmimorpha longicaudata TaxID=58733 RepID=UPI0030B8FF4F